MSTAFFSFKVRRSFWVVLGFVALLAIAAFCMTGCDYAPSADSKIAEKQESLQVRGVEEVGLPVIKNFTEMRRAKRIYELRDQVRTLTYTYTIDMNGRKHWFCDSIGYPLPYATQYSNPQKFTAGSIKDTAGTKYNMSGTLPQAEPNGLFMPSSADGTWVECINPNNPRETGVEYAEPHVITSPWPIPGALKD